MARVRKRKFNHKTTMKTGNGNAPRGSAPRTVAERSSHSGRSRNNCKRTVAFFQTYQPNRTEDRTNNMKTGTVKSQTSHLTSGTNSTFASPAATKESNSSNGSTPNSKSRMSSTSSSMELRSRNNAPRGSATSKTSRSAHCIEAGASKLVRMAQTRLPEVARAPQFCR